MLAALADCIPGMVSNCLEMRAEQPNPTRCGAREGISFPGDPILGPCQGWKRDPEISGAPPIFRGPSA